jgi:hypothetical protein
MKTFAEYKKEFGTVEYKGKEIALMSDAYPSDYANHQCAYEMNNKQQ